MIAEALPKTLRALVTDPDWDKMIFEMANVFRDAGADATINRKRAASWLFTPIWFLGATWCKWTAWRISGELHRHQIRMNRT